MNNNKKTLFVFDLDDTLIKTTARVVITDKSGNKKWLNAKQYGELKDSSDIKIDFAEFDDPKILSNEFKKPLFDVWKGMCKSGCNTLLLTAREQTNMIHNWCNKQGVSTKALSDNEQISGSYIQCVHDKDNKYVDPKLSTPLAKKKVIEKLIHNSGIENIIVFEDSEIICQEIEKIKENKNINVNLTVYRA
jgi:hypothetical protein